MKNAFDAAAAKIYTGSDYRLAQEGTATVLALITMGTALATNHPQAGITAFFASAIVGTWFGRAAHRCYNPSENPAPR